MNLAVSKLLNITILGKGQKPMLFAPGLGCSQAMWKHIVPAFAEDHKIVLLDYPGSGSNTDGYDPEKYNSLQAYADDIIAAVTELQLEETIFVGHSVSGSIGLLAAIKAPHLFSQIIMVNPSPCYINSPGYKGGFTREEINEILRRLKDNLVQWSDKYAPVIMGHKDRPVLAEELEQSFIVYNHKALCRFAELTFLSDLRKQLHLLSVPTLLLQGTEDVIAPVEVGTYMNKHIPGSTLVEVKSDGHCAHMSEPVEIVSAMKEYLALKAER